MFWVKDVTSKIGRLLLSSKINKKLHTNLCRQTGQFVSNAKLKHSSEGEKGFIKSVLTAGKVTLESVRLM